MVCTSFIPCAYNVYVLIIHRAVDINKHACVCTLQTLRNNGVSKCDVLTMDLVCHRISVCNFDFEIVLLHPQVSSFNERLSGKVDILLFNPPYVVTPSEEVYTFGDGTVFLCRFNV